MVDENKVRLMTRLAIYEKHENSRNLVLSKYYRSDYVRYNVLKTLVASTIVYWSVVGAYAFMEFDELLAKINDIDYFKLMYDLLAGYVAFSVIYFLFATLVYNYRYYKAKPGLVKYNINLKKLIDLESGTPVKSGKVVDHYNEEFDDRAVEGANEYNSQVRTSAQRSSRQVVSRAELVKQRMQQEERAKEQQIKDNVKQRNERIAAQNEAKLRQQRQLEQERRRIQERRKQLERVQMEKIRSEMMQQVDQVRENHVYHGSSDAEDMGRRDR